MKIVIDSASGSRSRVNKEDTRTVGDRPPKKTGRTTTDVSPPLDAPVRSPSARARARVLGTRCDAHHPGSVRGLRTRMLGNRRVTWHPYGF